MLALMLAFSHGNALPVVWIGFVPSDLYRNLITKVLC